MRSSIAAALMAALLAAPLALAQTTPAAPDLRAQIAACAQDTGPARCPATYQAVRASDCIAAGNASCLAQKATEAAAANDCDRAYQLVYACQCGSGYEAARDAVKAAGPAGVCKALKGS
jgi:hypothetical protein